jgi:hypothetical protein
MPPFWSSLRLQNRARSSVCELPFAAVPPDVRKSCALAHRVEWNSGLRPNQGRGPGMIMGHLRWGGAATAHRTAQPRTGVFIHSLPRSVL